jgi:hypothetical protein
MSSGSTVPDLDPELINAQNFNSAKPKLFFKSIGKYAATSTYIHVRIPFNFTTVFNTKQAIARVYEQLLDKHEEPFKSITKSVTDVSLAVIEGSLEDFLDIIKALPQKMKISMPGRPKRFIALGISIAAMAMSTFNTVRITQLNEEISNLNEKTDLILDVVHLHEKHLHHVEEKLEQTNKLLADLLEANVWFSSKVTDAIERKFESVVWHHENVVKSAQHHSLAPGALPHDVLDGIIKHVTAVAKKKNLVPFVTFASDLFQIKVSHLYSPATNKFTLILHVLMVANSNLLKLYKFLPLPIHFDFTANISITPDVGQTNLLPFSHSQSFQAISSTDLHACLHLGDTFFCKGRKVMETNLERSCLGALYMANSNSIQNHCRFKIAEAREKIFELSENIWAVYSISTISTNQVCLAANDVTAMQIQSGDTIKIKPGCYVRTMDHVISADESETIEIAIKTKDWAGKITDLFHYESKDAIHQAVQGLRNQYNGKFDATVLLDQLDQLDQRGQDNSPDAHWIFKSPAAMIGAAICLLGVGYCFWRCCCRTTMTTTVIQPLPSAPPMPMPTAPVQLPVPIRKTQNHGPRNNGTATDWNAKNNAIPINITIT